MPRPQSRLKSGLPPRSRNSSGGAPPEDGPASDGERLQKALARAGAGSRRHCEELITAGRVEVDGVAVTELGTKVRAGQHITVDGQPVTQSRHVYFLVNKPEGVVSTNDDPAGRTRVIDLLPEMRERLFTVGRLDMSSEGLMLVTNDGELANRLAHPRYEVEKSYHVLVAGQPEREVLDSLRRGVRLAEGLARATSVRIKKSLKQSTILEIVLREGKNREIRRVLAKVGHKVLRLKRVAIGSLRLGEMAPGEYRRLTTDELRSLRKGQSGSTARATSSVKRLRRQARPKAQASKTEASKIQVSKAQASTATAAPGRKGRRR